VATLMIFQLQPTFPMTQKCVIPPGLDATSVIFDFLELYVHGIIGGLEQKVLPAEWGRVPADCPPGRPTNSVKAMNRICFC